MSEYVLGNIRVREMHFEKVGGLHPGHAHNFDHVTYVIRGCIEIQKLDDADAVLAKVVKRASDGHNFLLIKAGVKHKIVAIEDDTMAHCIYSHRSPDGEFSEVYDGWEPAYV